MAAFITHSLTSTLSAASNAVTFLAVLLDDSSCFLQSQLVLSAGGNHSDLNLYLLYYYKDTSRSAIVQIHQRGNRCNTLVLQCSLSSPTDGHGHDELHRCSVLRSQTTVNCIPAVDLNSV